MFRIRRIYDDQLPASQAAIEGAKEIMRQRFVAMSPDEVEAVFASVLNPFLKHLQGVLFVAEDEKKRMLGFAVVLRDRTLQLAYLEFIAAGQALSSQGIGGALYETVREDARVFGAKGLFFECLPDEPSLCSDEALIKENRARLRFYEKYGARPIVGTKYEAPVRPTDTCPPHLVYDALDSEEPLRRSYAQKVVRAVLERKYKALCPPEYVEMVVASFKSDPVPLRPFRYVKSGDVKNDTPRPKPSRRVRERIALTVNAKHEIHHVRERGYVEAPVRITRIEKELMESDLFEPVKVRAFGDEHIFAVHEREFVRYLERTCMSLEGDRSLYPYVFPIRNAARMPKDKTVLAGYYCIDTFTPLHRNAYRAARRASNCALTAANQIIGGQRLAYALVRPPGHHAERRAFGGFCYLNHNAIAANLLSAHGKVAILDVDYHHGNGQQQIFYERRDVLTVSLHGDPSFAYPYFSGFSDEVGVGEGEGFNLNIPLPERLTGRGHLEQVKRALTRIADFGPRFLVVALGLDTARGDPTGSWSLESEDFDAMGATIGAAGWPTLVLQEGGYRTRTLGRNARRFFEGLSRGSRQ
ncbi:MAG: histone deacetylase family protein [Deltaproteobacteria bacterium]|nr:histone deacetylase family protein [Deltaproteobacteria bacterium]